MILLTDGQQRKTLAAVRSLGRRGVRAYVSEETPWATAAFSRYCAGGFVSPNAGKKPEEYFVWLKNTLEKERFEVLLPMDDCSMEVVMRYRGSLEKLCKLPVPDRGSFLAGSDKARSVQAALEAGIECPETIVVESLDKLSPAASALRFPVIIKPRKSSGSRGILKVDRREDLAGSYKKVHSRFPFPVIQEYVGPGEKYDVCLLFNRRSELKASFVQKEIRCFPLEMGPSTVQESVWRPDLVEKASRLMRGLNWYGVAEVEFMVDPVDGREKFMEINPRFWGSLHLSILSGVDFPWLLYRLAVDGDVEDAHEYAAGMRCRWLLPGDMLHFLYSRNRFGLEPSFFSTSRTGVHDDIVSLEDPLPAAGFLLACLRYLPDISMWRFMFRR